MRDDTGRERERESEREQKRCNKKKMDVVLTKPTHDNKNTHTQLGGSE